MCRDEFQILCHRRLPEPCRYREAVAAEARAVPAHSKTGDSPIHLETAGEGRLLTGAGRLADDHSQPFPNL